MNLLEKGISRTNRLRLASGVSFELRVQHFPNDAVLSVGSRVGSNHFARWPAGQGVSARQPRTAIADSWDFSFCCEIKM
jgi:hypothetical protein